MWTEQEWCFFQKLWWCDMWCCSVCSCFFRACNVHGFPKYSTLCIHRWYGRTPSVRGGVSGNTRKFISIFVKIRKMVVDRLLSIDVCEWLLSRSMSANRRRLCQIFDLLILYIGQIIILYLSAQTAPFWAVLSPQRSPCSHVREFQCVSFVNVAIEAFT